MAALSVAACLCSVLGAKLLSQSFEQSDLAVVAVGEDSRLQKLADSAPSPRNAKGATIGKSVDATATGTVAGKSALLPRGVSPCGEETRK